MKFKNILCFVFLFILILNLGSSIEVSSNEKEVHFFWGIGCPHCRNVESSNILEDIDAKVFSHEIYQDQKGRDLFIEYSNRVGLEKRGVPAVFIKCGDKLTYLIGDTPIIENLKDYVDKCDFEDKNNENFVVSSKKEKLTLITIILAALVDSINPCAFGVLIFLIASLLSVGSSKRALKLGITYSIIVFIVYFLIGLGVVNILQSFPNILKIILYVASGIFLLVAGIEIKDFFFYGKGFSLKIPTKFKPRIERMSKVGTLSAVIFLGIFVSLVEFPCTGGVYLGILSLMVANKAFGIAYLLLYNFIFVLPLIIITILTYKGLNTEKLQLWMEKNKKIMRFSTGIIMLLIAFYILKMAGGL